jgi:hypothetical protein
MRLKLKITGSSIMHQNPAALALGTLGLVAGFFGTQPLSGQERAPRSNWPGG